MSPIGNKKRGEKRLFEFGQAVVNNLGFLIFLPAELLTATVTVSHSLALECTLTSRTNGVSVISFSHTFIGVYLFDRHRNGLIGKSGKIADKQIVKVKIDSDRTTIFDDVVCRVSDAYAFAMHIDTDECNAACAFGEIYGEIIK